MKTERCPHCGQITMVRARSIRGELILALEQARHFDRPFKVAALRGLSRGAYADFTKLKYWGLIAEVPDQELWVVTTLGKDFMDGAVTIEKYRWIFNDKIQETPPGKKNPEISVYDIKDGIISTDIVRRNSLSYTDYVASKSGDLFR